MSDSDPLASWRPGPAKDAIAGFVRSVTEPGDSFVPPSERIAAFDNDGTLWCEKPLYVQADFLFRRWKEMADLGFAGVLVPEEFGGSGFGYVGLGQVLEAPPRRRRGVRRDHDRCVRGPGASFFDEACHPTLGVPYTQVGYRPMVELLRSSSGTGSARSSARAGARFRPRGRRGDVRDPA
jgi:hypothetical protein